MIEISKGETKKLGNCYHSYEYVVTSDEPVTREDLVPFRKAGKLGYGQSWDIGEPKLNGDGKYVTSVVDFVDSGD